METFETIAEIAATLIGFVGIFVAFRFSEIRIPKSDFVDFLTSAVGIVMFAFVPQLLSGAFADESTMWRVACGLFGVYHVAIFVFGSIQHLRERPATAFEFVFAVCSVPVMGLKLSVAAGVLVDSAYYIYLLGLVWLILNCLVIFYGIIVGALWGKDDERAK